MDTQSHFSTSNNKRGGWVTFPFIIASVAGLTLAGGGLTGNLIVYLIKEFNVKSIDAAQISNVVNGCSNLIPVLGAIIADSFFGCFSVVWISCFISLLGTILMTLMATLDSLRPQSCENGSSSCKTPSKLQFALLYTTLAFACIGQGGMRFTIATMGANQFHKPKDQEVYFNWFFFTIYVASVTATTAIVYVEDNAGWGLGFGLCVGANTLGLAIFVLGRRFYRHVKPEGSPFTGIARVFVASIKKRKVFLSSKSEDYYYGDGGERKLVDSTPPTNSFGFLNRAALKMEDNIKPDGSVSKPWKLCTVEQVEDLKTLIRIFPLWSTSIFLGTPIGIQASMVILQALTMDRHLGPHFNIPPASTLVFVFISTAISLTILDRFLWPTWHKLSGRSPTALQRIGVGHVCNVMGMAVSALVELKRLNLVHSKHHQGQNGATLSVLWLVPQLAIVGIGEAFHYPGQVALYYQEFPASLKTVSTAMISMLVAVAFYLSIALIDLIRRVTGWLPENINDGRVDNVYWVCAIIGVFNFGCYLICAWLYKYQSVEKAMDDSSVRIVEPSLR